MQAIAKFEKVSFEQFEKEWLKSFPDCKNVQRIYDEIKLPVRATSGSAGYDFFVPDDFELPVGKSVVIPTGIRAKINRGWVLCVYPRSGLGFKHRVGLDNTVGIVDSDYYFSSNEGHIIIKLSCSAHDDGHIARLSRGECFAQGLFTQFGITTDDVSKGVRNGGFGSTTQK